MTSPGQRIGIAVVLSHDATGCLVGIRPCEAPLGGMLEFPGGKCLQHESPREAALRECLEETGIAVEPLRQLEQRTVDYDHGRVELHFWLCQPRQAEPPPPARARNPLPSGLPRGCRFGGSPSHSKPRGSPKRMHS